MTITEYERKAFDEFDESYIDIVSSGYGWSEWHVKELTELLDKSKVNIEQITRWVTVMVNALQEGTEIDELEFLANYLDLKVQISFVSK